MPTYIGTLVTIPIWIFLFWRRKDLRIKMLAMSFLVSLLAVTDLLFIPEYWKPIVFFPVLGGKVDILAFVFCFITGGICTTIYEEIMAERSIREPKNRQHPLKLLILAVPIIIVVLRVSTSWNFMTITIIGLIVGITIIFIVRRDLAKDIVYSGALAAIFYTSILAIYLYIFPHVLTAWNFRTFPQVLIGNVPHFEIVWAGLTGAFIGPVFEFMSDLDVRRIPTNIRHVSHH